MLSRVVTHMLQFVLISVKDAKPRFHKVVSCRYMVFGDFGVILKNRYETENDSVAGSLSFYVVEIGFVLSQRHCRFLFFSVVIGFSRLLQSRQRPVTRDS